MDPDMHRIDETQSRRGEQFDRDVVGQTKLQQPFGNGEIPDTAPAAGFGRKSAVRDPEVSGVDHLDLDAPGHVGPCRGRDGDDGCRSEPQDPELAPTRPSTDKREGVFERAAAAKGGPELLLADSRDDEFPQQAGTAIEQITELAGLAGVQVILVVAGGQMLKMVHR